MEDPPLSIPNREVKLHSADGTAERWESRLAPNFEESQRCGSFFIFKITLVYVILCGNVSALFRQNKINYGSNFHNKCL